MKLDSLGLFCYRFCEKRPQHVNAPFLLYSLGGRDDGGERKKRQKKYKRAMFQFC